METVIEIIGVATKEDFYEVINTAKARDVDVEYLVYYKDHDPAPWHVMIKASEEDILWILRRLDDQRIYYETTSRLPTL